MKKEGISKRGEEVAGESGGGGKGLGRRGGGEGDPLRREGEQLSLGEEGAEGTGKEVSRRGRRRRKRRVSGSGEAK